MLDLKRQARSAQKLDSHRDVGPAPQTRKAERYYDGCQYQEGEAEHDNRKYGHRGAHWRSTSPQQAVNANYAVSWPLLVKVHAEGNYGDVSLPGPWR
jgi:hypothetical protein